MQRMQLSREDFDNPEVAGAVNPHPDYGYFTVPSRTQTPLTRPHPDPRHTYALTPGSRLSGVNSMVCDIAVNGNQICGQPLCRHIWNAHPGATLNPFRTNIPQADALKQWILSRGWRTARYVKEPGEGPMYSIIQDYCNFLKQLAQEDNNFAQQFGTEFHRPVYDPGIYSTYSLRMLIFPRGWHKSSPLPSKPPTPLSAPKRKRAPPKKGHKATGSRKQPARAKKDAAESVPETA
ncbi:uncharacterized protein ATNIH1004_011162 [Aspergillus tanneri]|uniref:Uncharacterized protein n=1 Tax=Aspergillus tanneri TaxID=1220188 RepID=A0A5M9M660_9EURO|nr:uncharacterized protein ATNIH1004_011162 [Aspergillus tanneri]KAA8642221.1 hypothetical protein ATNIH1004_011162 [Aspergillus tanneri]